MTSRGDHDGQCVEEGDACHEGSCSIPMAVITPKEGTSATESSLQVADTEGKVGNEQMCVVSVIPMPAVVPMSVVPMSAVPMSGIELDDSTSPKSYPVAMQEPLSMTVWGNDDGQCVEESHSATTSPIEPNRTATTTTTTTTTTATTTTNQTVSAASTTTLNQGDDQEPNTMPSPMEKDIAVTSESSSTDQRATGNAVAASNSINEPRFSVDNKADIIMKGDGGSTHSEGEACHEGSCSISMAVITPKDATSATESSLRAYPGLIPMAYPGLIPMADIELEDLTSPTEAPCQVGITPGERCIACWRAFLKRIDGCNWHDASYWFGTGSPCC